MVNVDDLPETRPVSFGKKMRKYDIIDLFIVSFYNFFTFALGLGLGFLLWCIK